MSEKMTEMGAGGVTGFQLPLGAHRAKKVKEVLDSSGDLKEGHALVFFRNAPEPVKAAFVEALDLMAYDVAAHLIREQVIREAVRSKIREVVRKKKGGGGYVLYAPNKGKKHNSKPLGSFPTKLAAKRAELARFPPKDPKKLQRLRREITKLMKDPKKRAEAEKKAAKQSGTDTGSAAAASAKPTVKSEAFTRDLMERAMLAETVIRHAELRMEGLFKEEAPGSEWDDFIGKVSSGVLNADRGYRRINIKMKQATEEALSKAVRIIQKQLGGDAKVKASQQPGTTEGGKTYIPFHIIADAAEVGPIYLYVDKGVPAIEMSDQAKSSLTKVTPGAAKAIRAALAAAQDVLQDLPGVRDSMLTRDAYLTKLQTRVDSMLANMSPLQISLLKQLLVKKYRGNK